jgi:hypothetical protein
VYLQLLLGWGEHGLGGAGAGCATVALNHIAAAAAILWDSPSSATTVRSSSASPRKASTTKLFTFTDFTAIENKQRKVSDESLTSHLKVEPLRHLCQLDYTYF